MLKSPFGRDPEPKIRSFRSRLSRRSGSSGSKLIGTSSRLYISFRSRAGQDGSTAEHPSMGQGIPIPSRSAIVGRMSMVSTLRRLTWPSRCCAGLTKSGTPRTSSGCSMFAGSRRDWVGRKLAPWSAATTIKQLW